MRKIDYHEFDCFDDENHLDDLNACSARDCTGTVTRGIRSDAERESYLDIYDFENDAIDDE